MQPPPADLPLLNHFSVLIYPFTHDIGEYNRRARLQALEARWSPWWARLSDAELAGAFEATAFFLPYIRGLLYPESLCLQDEPLGPHYQHWVELLRRWTGRGLEHFSRHLPSGSILRLTARASVRQALAEFTLVQRRGDGARVTEYRELPGRIDWVDVLLFPSGLGFLLLKVRVRQTDPGLGQLIALNSALRVVHPPSLAWTLPVLRLSMTGEELRVPDLMNGLTQGLVRPQEFLDGEAGPIFLRLPGGPDHKGYTDTEAGRAYGERCEVLSYACVHLGEVERLQLPAGVFASSEDRLLFELAASIGLGESVHNPIWVPSPEQAQRVTMINRLAMWRCWKAMALKESLVFLGTEDLNFNRRTLASNVENDYLPLYLYTLYQKFQLLTFSNDLMREVAQAAGRLRSARALQHRFVVFRNQYWFNEVTRKPMGGDLYRILQQGLEVNALYQMVTSSVKEAREYYEEVWHRKVQCAKDILTYVGPLTVILGAIRVCLSGTEFLWVALGLLLVLGGTTALFWLRLRKGFRSRIPGRKAIRSRQRRGNLLFALFRSRQLPWGTETQPAREGRV